MVPRGACRLVVLAALVACDGGGAASDAGADARPPAGQGAEPRFDVAINEVAARAPGPDWIELVNRGAAAVDVSGWFVSDAADRLDHYYEFPAGTVLEPGAYLVVFADDTTPATPGHASFELGQADGVVLMTEGGKVIDEIVYLSPDGVSLARTPDREGLFFPAAPSSGAANP